MTPQHARVTALAVLPHLARSVLGNHVRTYGYYASQIGLSPTRDGHKVGQAMHVIGAACVFKCVPVAPLHFVKTTSNEWHRLFISDALEARDVLPHFDTLLIAARIFKYSESDFEKVRSALEILTKQGGIGSFDFSPHRLWHMTVTWKPKNTSESYFERALGNYRAIIENERKRRDRAR